MKKILILLALSIAINSSWASCLSPAEFKLIGLPSEKVFRVSRCTLPQINKSLAQTLETENGTQINSFSLEKSKLPHIKNALAQDYREYKGSAPLSERGFDLLNRFAKSEAASLMQFGEIIETYKNEKGRSDLITFFSKDYSLLIVVTKFKFAN